MLPFRSLIPSLALVVIASLIGGCATPSWWLDRHAERLGFDRVVVSGAPFAHVIYRNPDWGQPGVLHVYLDGDGTPFLERSIVAADPTPRNPLVLGLMALDDAPSAYLGRPCYHGQAAATPACASALWTTQRYSEAVVASMAAALERLATAGPYNELALIGYSGGGALAQLLAARLSRQTCAVVTVAANLDTARWTAWHGYSPLLGSLNPADQPPLPARIVQLHYAGGHDINVPPKLSRHVSARQTHSRFIVLDDYDHACCWRDAWPAVLEQLASALDSPQSRRGRGGQK